MTGAWQEFLTEKVNLIRMNGEKVDGIPASVHENEVLIVDFSLQMEEGDKLTRLLPNGLEEKYLIVNINFQRDPVDEEDSIIKISVRKETKIDTLRPIHQEFHTHGDNSPMNIDSPNSPISITNIAQDGLFENLRYLVDKQITDISAKSDLLKKVDELEDAQDKKSYLEHYTNFIASAANHVTLWVGLSPLIPALNNLIHILK